MKCSTPTDAPSTEPLLISINETMRLTSWGRSRVYQELAAGLIVAKRSGRRTLLVLASVKARVDDLPCAVFKAVGDNSPATAASAPGTPPTADLTPAKTGNAP